MKNFKDKNGNLLARVYTIDEIVANPQLEGNEPELHGVQVGNQKYKMPQGGGSGASLQYAHVTASLNGYSYGFTFLCDDNTIETAQDLAEWLQAKDFVKANDKDWYEAPFLPVVSCFSEGNSVLGFTFAHETTHNYDEDTEDSETPVDCIAMLGEYGNATTYSVKYLQNSGFEITFLGNE